MHQENEDYNCKRSGAKTEESELVRRNTQNVSTSVKRI